MLVESISLLDEGKATSLLQQSEKLDNKITETTFDSLIIHGVENLDDSLSKADTLTSDYALGTADIQDVMLAVEEASMTMQLAVTVRNKMVEGLQELLRMQL
ncbi:MULTISPECIES: flagellar hook-basal body complex protein FliE [unclassified Agarivorans]|uniref:flagellar hook-basal body complex protein FliE n=1 Tax=unclassified Agarivorans TaxID=2636026 RepID=UPI0026E25B1C|nr:MULTISPECIES: flagellar hook-basal body complex protein FliE [unclassified Agarivorans]MDO6685852.1 flagellar hook-basal body complex protein FliE [Agarivorans sp. 3_MG-2023]MDO6716033.1 flagellar hook-basal body complex protein FliE [Agarivorans sp. 2_MG-2023]